MKNKTRQIYHLTLSPDEHFVPIDFVQNLIKDYLIQNGIKIKDEYVREYYFGSLAGFIITSDAKRKEFDEIIK